MSHPTYDGLEALAAPDRARQEAVPNGITILDSPRI